MRSPGSAAPDRPHALAIVPARLASTRLPRKMLLAETGQPLFVHTVQNLARTQLFARIVVATDSAEILDAARAAGVEALMTRSDHQSGTDRVFEAWQALREGGATARVIVNVQGDEPELAVVDLAALVAAFEDQEVRIATLAASIASTAEAQRTDIVKVVCDRRGDALYFSRALIPSLGHARSAPGADASARFSILRRHVGVYAFVPSALERFCTLPASPLEMHENLEQLRWLEAGERMRVVAAAHVPRGIDTAEDYQQFVARVRASGVEATRGGIGKARGG